MLLKLVNDVSSIEATLQSNHTLKNVDVQSNNYYCFDRDHHISNATRINSSASNPYRVGRAKVIETQLNSVIRAELGELQGVNHSVYSEINPLHLPEVLALVDRHHGQGELFVALRSSIAGVISTINRKQFLKEQWEYHNAIAAEHRAKMETIEAELKTIEAAEAPGVNSGTSLAAAKDVELHDSLLQQKKRHDRGCSGLDQFQFHCYTLTKRFLKITIQLLSESSN